MSTMNTLLRRELWEHRAILVTPVVVGILIIAALLLPIVAGTLGDVSVDGLPDDMEKLTPEKAQAIWTVAGAGLAFPFELAMVLVTTFYLLDCLYAERKDRSILFWKSLPVSDAEVVLSKLATAVIVIPVVTVAVFAVTSFVGWGITAGFLSSLGDEGRMLVAGPGSVFQGIVLAAYLFAAQALWYLPFYGWLLLVSAFANRALLLWATLPPLALMWLERAGLGTNEFAELLGHRSLGFLDSALRTENAAGVTRLANGDTNIAIEATGNVWPLLDPVGLLTSPGLWAGIAVAAVFVTAAIWLRRYRDEA
jgi:ABC-2 type transport system permease protein